MEWMHLVNYFLMIFLIELLIIIDRVGSSIKDRIVVRYVNEFGEDEAGIDIGGLFKDFWTDLSARVFNPSFGLFAITSSQVYHYLS